MENLPAKTPEAMRIGILRTISGASSSHQLPTEMLGVGERGSLEWSGLLITLLGMPLSLNVSGGAEQRNVPRVSIAKLYSHNLRLGEVTRRI